MSDKPKRSPMAPTKLSSEDYARRVAEHLKNREGAVPRIYTDTKGIPTMGPGINVLVPTKKGYALRDLDQIGADPAKP